MCPHSAHIRAHVRAAGVAAPSPRCPNHAERPASARADESPTWPSIAAGVRDEVSFTAQKRVLVEKVKAW